MKRFLLVCLLAIFFISSYAQKNYRETFEIKAGTYLFNYENLYFFDDGIKCYLTKICRDIDTVYENKSINVKIKNDTVIKVQAYLFTDNYEYMYVKMGKNEGWLRAEIPLDPETKVFFERYLLSAYFESHSCYVEVIPFKTPSKVFMSTTDEWFIANLSRKNAEVIGSKGGRLEACQMVFSKNCVKCYIGLGWGEEVWYDENAKKKKVK